jgi:hypothetical protein
MSGLIVLMMARALVGTNFLASEIRLSLINIQIFISSVEGHYNASMTFNIQRETHNLFDKLMAISANKDMNCGQLHDDQGIDVCSCRKSIRVAKKIAQNCTISGPALLDN